MLLNEVFTTPAKMVATMVAGGVLLIIVAQLFLLFFNYSVERLYLNKNVKILANEIEENGGLKSYNNNDCYYTSVFSGSDDLNLQGGTGEPLRDIVQLEFVHADASPDASEWTVGHGVAGSANTSAITAKPDDSILSGVGFFTRTNYSVDVDVAEIAYIGRTVTLTVHRDLGFKMFWSIPFVVHLSGSTSYTYDDVYNPASGVRRETGGIYLS